MEPQVQTPHLLSLVEDIRQAALEECSSSRSASSHYRFLGLIDQLKYAVETPTETVLRLIYQPPQNAALRTVVDLDIFPLLLEHPNKGLSAIQLAESTGAERALIIRLMRVMAALGLCASVEPEVYIPTEKTVALTQPIGRDGIPCIYDLTVPTLARLPEYFREHHYIMPKEYSRSPMWWAVGQSQFEWLAQRKHHQTLFNSYMSSRRQGKPSWFDVYPVDRLATEALDHEDAAFLVDVGGNQGHDLIRFREKYPDVTGRLVLQDLPKVVNSATVGDEIEVMPYSFLDPQPVKGARAYYFRSIFHDWPDYICHKILVNTVSAMSADYSRIIIVDFVLLDTDAPLLQASIDIQMMSIGSGVERSKRQWRELLGAAGLVITGIWSGSPGMESVIEAVPVRTSRI
ncbi:S-adenosyl-L-methionine-dependent methyltransferase [Aspergillus alliaceus]|uniref:S-adenosyl-L-methionine-dependent methyltransferase n=1 Tax=Petromyces alliaceus TaxID=209559 RepID=UPI0012A58186|nr:S-adenosyl-L-methionine-dependent methyltransferase [Aspergillus alliaceus]KAB8238223.1 S-adenosyl-L-methionine-dependent methyltransferase [Aspergillus alliaceus]